MKRRRFASILGGTAIASFTGLPAHADQSAACGIPQERGDGWAVLSADDASLIDRAALCRMANGLVASSANVHSILVVRRGKLVFERYFIGTDEVPGFFIRRRVAQVAFDADTLHDLKSVSKSVASLVVGIAIDRGLIRGIDEPIFSFFPELADLRTPEKDRILLRHVLTMTMGLQWIEAAPATEQANDEARMHMARDQCRYVLGLPIVALAGQEFHYSTGALALVSAIVRKAAGRPLDEFARAGLFAPLAIAPDQWARIQGDTDAGGGLRLRPRDMAKIGQLVLAGGNWYGRQVVSKDWVASSTAPQVKATDDQQYGDLWWLGRARTDRRVVPWVGAQGRGGQSIRVVPELDLVVVVTAGYYQDYSPQAFRLQYGVFRDVLRATRDV
jgi:CubicO group peptidase (beta-lactamase class C family)